MIRFKCPSCQAKLNAKEELAGLTRKCPKCGATVEVPQPDASAEASSEQWAGLDDVAADQHVHDVLDHQLPTVEAPQRLARLNRYLIIDRTSLIALCEGSGQGWMLKTNAGLIRVSRDPEALPSQGDFTLVELVMAMTDEGLRLCGIRNYELAKRWALTTLEQGEHRILSRITGPGRLNKQQKAVVMKFLHERFMRNIWEEAAEVLDYLTNLDYHSQGVG